MAPRMPSDREKPVVGLIFSESEKESNESRFLAYYFAGVLVNTGYAKCALIGYRSDGLPSGLYQQRVDCGEAIAVLPPGKVFRSVADVEIIPVSDVNTVEAMMKPQPTGPGTGALHTTAASNTSYRNHHSSSNGIPQLAFCHWNELARCDVLIVTVNSPDSISCAAKIALVLDQADGMKRPPVVFTLQRGVRMNGIIKDG